jgi:demethylspheroidene O-methyltransferase
MAQRLAGFSLIERVLAFRDRILSNRAFQLWAFGFPPTRGIATRRSKALFDLCAGFVYSQALAACLQLGLFALLSDGPLTEEQIAIRLSLSREAAQTLLQAALALRLLERRRGGRFGLGPLGLAAVGNPEVASMVQHHTMLYADLSDPVALLRGEQRDTALRRVWPYAGRPDAGPLGSDEVAHYSALMADSLPLVAADILAAYSLQRHRCLLDLGGGDGSFLARVADAAPDLRLMLLDLPAVAEQARARFAKTGLSGRAEAFGGDFRTGPLPSGADIISLVRVIHDHDDEIALAILRTARAALPPGGALLLAEPMDGTVGAETVGAYFAFYLLAMGSGRPRSVHELSSMLKQAGFANVALVATRRPMLVRVLIAYC